MHSSELPVTEWWDPEWDVYEVPGYALQDTIEDFDLWWLTWDFTAEIGYIMTGDRFYSPPNLYQHQLISGHYRDCPTYGGGLCDGTCWIAYHKQQPYAHAQPVERFGRPPACMCRYGHRVVPGIPGTHEMDPFREGWRRGVYAFRIHPKCPHHGDVRRLDRDR